MLAAFPAVGRAACPAAQNYSCHHVPNPQAPCPKIRQCPFCLLFINILNISPKALQFFHKTHFFLLPCVKIPPSMKSGSAAGTFSSSPLLIRKALFFALLFRKTALWL